MRAMVIIVRSVVLVALCVATTTALAQTASGTINGTFIHISGIALTFNTDAANNGIPLGGTSTAATMNFGTVSAFGSISSNIARTVTATDYQLRSYFATQVSVGGYTSYDLDVQLAAPPPTPGITYRIDGLPAAGLSNGGATRLVTGSTLVDQNVSHYLDLTISRLAPGAGGPAVGTPISVTINFTATAH